MSTAVVVLAGGAGARLQRAENKVYLPLHGRALLAWSLDAFEQAARVDRIVLVVRAGDEDRAAAVVDGLRLTKLTDVVVGGRTRHDSEQAGLSALAASIEAGDVDLVAIHDAARPFVAPELLERVLDRARAVGGAIPGLTLDGEFLLRVEADEVPTPVPTSDLRRVQTPQAFRASPLLEAYRRASAAGFHGVDTAESVERFSDLEVEIVPGDPRNLKVTFVEDLIVAEEQAASWTTGARANDDA